MTIEDRIEKIIDISWESYKYKVANGLLQPENEKMMQLQIALILQSVSALFEYKIAESIKVLLEYPVFIMNNVRRIIDIVLSYKNNADEFYFPIELKCYRKFTRDGKGKRGAGNLGMYDYWEDIENIEHYARLDNFQFATQLTLTDDPYYATGKHAGSQVAVYSTNRTRESVFGSLVQSIKNRKGEITLDGVYSMKGWEEIDNKFYFIKQKAQRLVSAT